MAPVYSFLMVVSKKICDQLSDLEIIRKSLQEVDYFSCLYQRYEDRLMRYVKRLAAVSNEEAEDILQDAFIKIWKNLNAFDTDLKPSTWIYRIVHNQTISFWRKKTSYGKDQKVEWDEEKYADVWSEELQIEDERIDDREQIWSILTRLPIKYKEVLVLKFLENMSYEEISDILKMPEGTVATRINRAKKSFIRLSKVKSE
jgi:RNA polymerase sigma-70 factor (ECF subfamily)